VNDEEALVRSLVLTPGDEGLLSVFFDWLEDRGVAGGVVWFHTAPAFSEPLSYLFVYSEATVTVATAYGATTPWRWLPLPNFMSRAVSTSAVITWERLAAERAKPINTWEDLRRLALAAPNCHTPGVADGTIYRHELRDREVSLAVSWHNPNATDHPAQRTLISAYGGLIALANLLPNQVADRQGGGQGRGPPLTHSGTLEEALRAFQEAEDNRRRLGAGRPSESWQQRRRRRFGAGKGWLEDE
jgi:hypothetical protein